MCRWCRLIRCEKVSQVAVIVVEDVAAADVTEHPECFQYLTGEDNFQVVSIFSRLLDVSNFLFYVVSIFCIFHTACR